MLIYFYIGLPYIWFNRKEEIETLHNYFKFIFIFGCNLSCYNSSCSDHTSQWQCTECIIMFLCNQSKLLYYLWQNEALLCKTVGDNANLISYWVNTCTCMLRVKMVLAIFLSLFPQDLAQTEFQTHIQSIYTSCNAKINQRSAIQVTKKVN